jgi:hypothetical protein
MCKVTIKKVTNTVRDIKGEGRGKAKSGIPIIRPINRVTVLRQP